LHPLRGLDTDVFRNTCGNLTYPLLFSAERGSTGKYKLVSFDPSVIESGECR
jgi:hypothetical protein